RDPLVRVQTAYTLGAWDDPRAGAVLARLAVRDARDRFLSAAVMSSLNKANLEAVMLGVLAEAKTAGPPPGVMANLFRTAAGLKPPKALASLLTAVGTPEKEAGAKWHLVALAGLLDGLEAQGSSLARVSKEGNDEVRDAVTNLVPLFSAARRAATEPMND